MRLWHGYELISRHGTSGASNSTNSCRHRCCRRGSAPRLAPSASTTRTRLPHPRRTPPLPSRRPSASLRAAWVYYSILDTFITFTVTILPWTATAQKQHRGVRYMMDYNEGIFKLPSTVMVCRARPRHILSYRDDTEDWHLVRQDVLPWCNVVRSYKDFCCVTCEWATRLQGLLLCFSLEYVFSYAFRILGWKILCHAVSETV